MPDLITFAIPAFVALLFAEAIAGAIMKREIYELKDAAASISMGLGNVFVDLLAKALQFSILTWLHRFAIFSIGFQWWAWVLLFFGRSHGGGCHLSSAHPGVFLLPEIF